MKYGCAKATSRASVVPRPLQVPAGRLLGTPLHSLPPAARRRVQTRTLRCCPPSVPLASLQHLQHC